MSQVCATVFVAQTAPRGWWLGAGREGRRSEKPHQSSNPPHPSVLAHTCSLPYPGPELYFNLRTLAVRRGLAPPDFFSMLRLAGGRCRSVLLDQRSTTQQHWRGPGISGSTQGYLALPLRQELCVATGRGEGVAGLCSTREAPRRTGVGPAYLVQPKATWHSPLGKSSLLRLARGRCRWVLLDQRGTTPDWRGPGISGSTQGYLALPLR